MQMMVSKCHKRFGLPYLRLQVKVASKIWNEKVKVYKKEDPIKGNRIVVIGTKGNVI